MDEKEKKYQSFSKMNNNKIEFTKIDKSIPANVLEKHRILTLVTEGMMSITSAANTLSLSYRHIRRLLKHFKTNNRTVECLVHKRNTQAWNKVPTEVKLKVLKVQEESFTLNLCHLSDILKTNHSISMVPSTIRTILIEAGRYAPKVKRYRRRKRFEKEAFGELVQIDTSEHLWIPDLGKHYLVLLLDDFSRFILSAFLFEADTTWNTMTTIRDAVEKYGIFEILYSDNASQFKLIRTGYSRHFEYKVDLENVQTQIHRACLELGIILLNHPVGECQAKGKIEKIFQFLQDRFVTYLKQLKVKTLKQANKALQKWIKWYNTKHLHSITGVVPTARLTPSVCKPLPEGINLDDIFCIKEIRTVKKDNTFEFQNKTYQLTKLPPQSRWDKTIIELHILPEKCIRVFHKDNFIQQFSYKRCPPQRDMIVQKL